MKEDRERTRDRTRDKKEGPLLGARLGQLDYSTIGRNSCVSGGIAAALEGRGLIPGQGTSRSSRLDSIRNAQKPRLISMTELDYLTLDDL